MKVIHQIAGDDHEVDILLIGGSDHRSQIIGEIVVSKPQTPALMPVTGFAEDLRDDAISESNVGIGEVEKLKIRLLGEVGNID